MISFTMMVCYRSGLVLQRPLADVGQASVDQGEHVLCHLSIEQPPLILNRNIDRRRVGKAAAMQRIMVLKRNIVRASTARRKPRMMINLDVDFQLEAPRPVIVMGFRDDFALLHELQRVQWEG